MLLTIENLSVYYQNQFLALDNISLHLQPGEVLALVGESGCGKSTLAKAILRILPENTQISGKIHVHKTDVLGIPPSQLAAWRGRQVGLIFQDPMTRFNPFLSLAAHGEELLGAHGIPRQEGRQRLRQVFTQVRIDPDRLSQFPHELSGGMRQRAMIALALLLEPCLLIADEPTTSLDATVAASILREVITLCRDHSMGILLISHDLGMVARYADRVAVMESGRIVEINTPHQIFLHPQHIYTQQLVQLPPLSHHPMPWTGDPLLRVSHLYKAFRQGWRTFSALSDVSFAVHKGEVLGIIGESGSGKSTTARIICQLLPPDRGSVYLEEEDLTLLRGEKLRKVRQKLQLIFQDPRAALNPHMSVLQAIADPLYIHQLATDREEVRALVLQALEQVGLSALFLQRLPKELSGGQLQRVALARAIVIRPQLLVCDEPVSMLDAALQKQVLELLIHLKKAYQLTMVFITHDLAVAQSFCDRLCVMYQGAIVETGTATKILTDPDHPYTQQLVTAMPPLPST